MSIGSLNVHFSSPSFVSVFVSAENTASYSVVASLRSSTVFTVLALAPMTQASNIVTNSKLFFFINC